MSNPNRVKGLGYERALAIRFREMGWFDCVTARAQNRRLDDAKIDLCFTYPLAIQAKYTKAAPNFHKLLSEMQSACDTLPEVKNCHPIVYHKRAHQGETVTMMAADFEEMISVLKAEQIWNK